MSGLYQMNQWLSPFLSSGYPQTPVTLGCCWRPTCTWWKTWRCIYGGHIIKSKDLDWNGGGGGILIPLQIKPVFWLYIIAFKDSFSIFSNSRKISSNSGIGSSTRCCCYYRCCNSRSKTCASPVTLCFRSEMFLVVLTATAECNE